MTNEYLLEEDGYFFTDVNAPDIVVASYGDMNPPGSPETIPPEPGVSTIESGKVVRYEDDTVVMNTFVYSGNTLISYRELTKATGGIIQYTFTTTAGPALEAVGTNEDYQNFGVSGDVSSLGDDVPNASIQNYSVTETIIV